MTAADTMKTCPKCNETYKDDINYCLSDGATLLKKRSGTQQLHSRANEIMAFVLVAAAVLVLLALLTYSPTDWSLNTVSNQRTQNWIGVVGAVAADLLFQSLGIAAYIFPVLISLIAWRVFRSQSLRPGIGHIAGVLLFIVSAAGLAHFAGMHGGITGAFFYRYSANLLGSIGAGILLFTALVASVLLLTNFTLRSALGHFELAWANLKLRFADWRNRRQGDRTEAVDQAKVRAEKRREIREARSGKLTPVTTDADVPPMISTGELAVGAAASVSNGRSAENDSVQPSIPTIAAKERPRETTATNERESADLLGLDAKLGHIPITPMKHTGDLEDEDPTAQTTDEPESVPHRKTEQNYDSYVLPGSHLLNPPAPHIEQKEKELLAIAESLSEKTREFNVSGKVVNICPGPVVTTYEFKPDPGVKYSRVTGLVDDLCLALKAESIRIDRIPGKAFVGIEVPNSKRETIRLRDVIESRKFRESDSKLSIALGKTIDGLNYVTDLAKMPHLLIAGATGAGKSVGVNSLVVSILYKSKPDEVKFIMVDPKRLELGVYADIPHLATPIITDPKRAAISLRWAVAEMERRYKDLAGWGVRNIDGFNLEVKRKNDLKQWDDNGDPHKPLPYIVIIIDELADLMMVSGKEVEEAITRLAQMARAVGIHLVLATQRPSVDVITGLIKANFPARISFRVSSKVDSRTIIDGNGAESLLGKGDMLFLPPASSQVIRVHGAFVDEKEISKIVEHIKSQGRPEYDTSITKSDDELDDAGDLPGRRDPLFLDALKTVVSAKRGSTSLLQRHLRIGYGRAAAILDAMVKEGYIGDMDGSTRARPVLQRAYDDLRDLEEMDDS